MYLGKYGLPKQRLDECLKRPISKHPWTSQHAKGPQTLLNSALEHFYYFDGSAVRKSLSN